MNDSQLPAEISPKLSRTRGEGDETRRVEEGKGLIAAVKDKNADVSNITLHGRHRAMAGTALCCLLAKVRCDQIKLKCVRATSLQS